MPIVHGSVWRGALLLGAHSEFNGNWEQVAQAHLAAAGRNGGFYTYVVDAFTLNFYCSEGHVFLVVADEQYGRAIPHAVLTKMQQQFAALSSAQKADASAIGKKIKEVIREATATPDAFCNITRVQGQVNGVKDVMVQNIEKVLLRGEHLDSLAGKTDDLVLQADSFMRTGKNLKRRMWCQNLKMKLVVAFAVILLAVVIFLLACFSGRNCLKKS